MRGLWLGLCLMAVTSPALAADLPAPAPAYVPAVAPIYNWSGIYIGANVGAAFDYQGAPDNTVATGPFAATPTGGTSHRSTGIAAGGQLAPNICSSIWRS